MREPRHYAIERWVDYARGLTPAEEASRMAVHAGRCKTCRETMDFWTRLAVTAHGMARQVGRSTSGS
jgi:anti-sigma factor RsiW